MFRWNRTSGREPARLLDAELLVEGVAPMLLGGSGPPDISNLLTGDHERDTEIGRHLGMGDRRGRDEEQCQPQNAFEHHRHREHHASPGLNGQA
ncbi:MAG: hypothetical protein ABI766_09355 [Gemmatimonadales bacterium]